MKKILLFFCFFVFLFFCFGAKGANAAYFSLDPQTHTASSQTTFDVKLKINTEAEQVTSADVVLLFDEAILEVTSITAQGDTYFFPQNFKSISSGKVYIGGAVENATQFKTGEGLLATLTFKGKGNGATVVRFDCTPGKTSDSNISKNNSEATDILDCAKLVNGTYTIGGGSDNSPTPRPTFGPTCTVTPQPSPTGELPEAGVTTPSILLLGIGGLLTTLGFLLIF